MVFIIVLIYAHQLDAVSRFISDVLLKNSHCVVCVRVRVRVRVRARARVKCCFLEKSNEIQSQHSQLHDIII